MDNDDTEDKQLFITELKDNNEVDDENSERYNLNFLYHRLHEFYIYKWLIKLYNFYILYVTFSTSSERMNDCYGHINLNHLSSTIKIYYVQDLIKIWILIYIKYIINKLMNFLN